MTYYSSLLSQIQAKTARIVVIGVGYVGLPVAARFAEAGFSVTGLDVHKAKVAEINQGLCPIEGEEPGLAELITAQVATGRLLSLIHIFVIIPHDLATLAQRQSIRFVSERLRVQIPWVALFHTNPGPARVFCLWERWGNSEEFGEL